MENSSKYPKPSLSVDLVIVRHSHEGKEILLVRRGHEPFAGCWALPGGFMDIDESLEDAARRELREETSVDIPAQELELVGVFSRVDRDPRGRVVSVAYRANVPPSVRIAAGDDAHDVAWHAVNRLPSLAFDHDEIIAAALHKTEKSSAARTR